MTPNDNDNGFDARRTMFFQHAGEGGQGTASACHRLTPHRTGEDHLVKRLSPTPNGKRIDMIIPQALMRAGAQLWPVYYQLVSDIGKGADGFTNGRLAATLHMPRRTLRRHLSVLRCMGLVAPMVKSRVVCKSV